MTKKEQFRKNNELFGLFMQQVLENPEFTEKIPQDAEIIFLPQNDPELCEINLKLGESHKKEGKTVAYVRIELEPRVQTIFVPHLEVTEIH